MSDGIYKDDGQFTDAYKFQIMTHPVLKNLSQLLLEASKIEQKQDEELIYNKFANNLELSAQAFHDLGTDAFKAAEIVQHGLHLLNCMLYQFFPNNR